MVVSVLRLVLLTIAGHLWAGPRFVAGYSPVRKDLHCPASGPAHSDLALEVRGSLNSLCAGECLTCGRGRELSLRSWGSLRVPLGKGCSQTQTLLHFPSPYPSKLPFWECRPQGSCSLRQSCPHPRKGSGDPCSNPSFTHTSYTTLVKSFVLCSHPTIHLRGKCSTG